MKAQATLLRLQFDIDLCTHLHVNKRTKQQPVHLLTAAFKDLHIKNSKNHKKVILPASH